MKIEGEVNAKNEINDLLDVYEVGYIQEVATQIWK